MSNWCWIAVPLSVASYYKTPNPMPTQGQLANKLLGLSVCAVTTPPEDPCDQTGKPVASLNELGHLNYPQDDPINFSTIVGEIDAGRPVVVTLKWIGNPDAHVVAISGYDDTTPGASIIDIQDPGDGAGFSTQAYSGFPKNYNQGASWESTTFTKT